MLHFVQKKKKHHRVEYYFGFTNERVRRLVRCLSTAYSEFVGNDQHLLLKHSTDLLKTKRKFYERDI